MEFVNSIARIVHLEVTLHGGFPNKNIGDAFLLVWKLPDMPKPGESGAGVYVVITVSLRDLVIHIHVIRSFYCVIFVVMTGCCITYKHRSFRQLTGYCLCGPHEHPLLVVCSCITLVPTLIVVGICVRLLVL